MFKIPELRKRSLFTLGMLAVYRVGIFITTPGVDRNVMRKIMAKQSGTFLGMFNLFTGGALEQLSIFALGIMPYVSASIILTLLIGGRAAARRAAQRGRVRPAQAQPVDALRHDRLSAVQSMGIALFLEGLNSSQGQFGDVVANPGWGFRLITIISLTTGTAFIMWLGEQITERGLGNGISLIIFAGIVVRLPDAVFHTVSQVKIGQIQPIRC